MTSSHPAVLIVDDERNMRLSLQTLLTEEGYAVQAAESGEEALRLLERESISMVISDARLGGMSGHQLLSHVGERWPDLPVLLITAYATPKLAIEAIKAGAADYLPKPFAPEELLHAVRRCVEHDRLIRENRQLRERSGERFGLDRLVGDSPAMQELHRLIETVAPTDARVLILGESGTGKELVAGALHALSQRSNEPYVRINCAAIPETLLESELFGHEKGSFTGATRQKSGRVEEADRGTLFLDEIADMSGSLQAKLLRFLEDGTFTRVGGTRELRVDVRLLAATNRDIAESISAGQFREDLFHRLNVVQFRLLPLRERGEDVGLLAEYFRQVLGPVVNPRIRGISRAAQRKLASHSWPGNVRELRNAVERALILETGREIQAASLPEFVVESRLGRETGSASSLDGSLDEMVASYERELILKVLEQNRFNLGRAAERLKLSRHALRYRMQRLNIGADAEDTPSPSGRPSAA